MTHHLVAIPPDKVRRLRPILERFVVDACRELPDEFPDALLEAASEHQGVVLAITDDDRVAVEDCICAVAVLAIDRFAPDKYPEIGTDPVLQVCTLSGTKMHEWLDDLFIPNLELLAAEQGCVGITATGRPGWMRHLAQRNWRKVTTDEGGWAMFLEVPHGIQ